MEYLGDIHLKMKIICILWLRALFIYLDCFDVKLLFFSVEVFPLSKIVWNEITDRGK